MRERETRRDATEPSISLNTIETTLAISKSTPAIGRLTEGPANVERNDATDRDTVSPIELKTYKSLVPLLPAEENCVEETPPASIFVIEADVVNHTASDRLREALRVSLDEESRDRIDVMTG